MIGQPEQAHRVVPERVDLGRRHPDPHAGCQQLVERGLGGSAELGRGQKADRVAHEHRHDAGAPVLHELARVADIGRGEQVHALAFFDALAHAP